MPHIFHTILYYALCGKMKKNDFSCGSGGDFPHNKHIHTLTTMCARVSIITHGVDCGEAGVNVDLVWIIDKRNTVWQIYNVDGRWGFAAVGAFLSI